MFLLICITLLLINLLLLVNACPQYVAAVCRCEELHNGVSLNCSSSDGVPTIELLRANQANLGLIQQLTVQNAQLTRLPAGFFSGLYIKKLDLSHNRLYEIHPNAFLGMNNVLQELRLNHNNLTVLPATALIPLTTLLRLDLSNNSIGDLQPENALPSLPKLYDINLADNRICHVHKSVFDQVKGSTQTVNLGRNCLDAVPASAIRGFKQLVALHLHGNNITALDALSFMNLPVMNLLNLASNQIRDIHRQAFLNVPNLRYLYLTRNRITEILPHQFSSFEQLEMLDFTSNYLLHIPRDAFSHLQNLRQLYLGENRISTIESGSFTNSSVVILVLNSNRLTHLKEKVFDGMAKLQQISIKDNQIRTIDQNTFYTNPSLVMIDLSENELIDIPSATFLSQLNIFLIDLSRNKLIRTPYGAFSRRIKTVLLQENPLVCTERVHMLQEGVGVYVPNSEDSICGTKLQHSHPNNVTLTEDKREAINMAEEEFFTPTNANVHDSSTPFIQESNVAPKTRPTIIQPLSALTSQQESVSSGSYLTGNTHERQLVPVHPINAPANIAPGQLPDSNIPNQQNPFLSHNPGDRILPRIEITPIASRNRGNFGFGKPRNRTITENTSHRDSATSTENPSNMNNMNDPFSVDNPNVIHPFPVPFLSRPPKIFPAYVATTTPNTLPPSIVIAQQSAESDSDQDTIDSGGKFERVELMTRTATPKKAGEIDEQFPFEIDPSERLERLGAPSVIIIMCLSTVAIVMGAVFVGLCIAKHRRMQRFGSSSASSAAAMRTNAYVTAQAAHMNMLYGSAHRNRNQTACSCFAYIDGIVIKCNGPEGPGVVEQLKKNPLEIRELALENANIIEIGRHAFRNLRIKKLVLDNNHIRALHPDAFRGLESVMQELSISKNKLTAVPTDSLIAMRALSVLSLKCNNIGDINTPIFRNLSSLIDLNLGCNQICNIEGPAFHDVRRSLQNLILDNNCLTAIPSDAIRNLDNLIGLHIKYNQICNIEGPAFHDVRRSLQNLILDNNCLTAIPSDAIRNLDNLIGLHIKYNQIQKLQKLQLTNLSSLTILTLTGNKITTLQRNIMPEAENLKYLYLGSNDIKSLEPSVLSQFTQVQVIDLSYNHLSEITEDMFSGLEHLQHLNLEGNVITDIAPGAFATTPLLLLWLPNNCLNSVVANMFQGAPFLRQVSLANNNIRTVQPLSFAHLANLHTLDLSHNKIQVLQPGAITGSDHLTVRLQENPMVCSQDGFHVMNGREAINLTTEPNLICKTDYMKDTKDVCPKGVEPPQPPPCCSRMHVSATTTTTTPSTTDLTTVAETSTTDIQDETSEHPVTKTTPRKLNLERFFRLSRRPVDSKFSPFLRHRMPHGSQAANTQILSINAPPSSKETQSKTDRRVPSRVEERQRQLALTRSQLPPWIRTSAKDKGETVEFSTDSRVESVRVHDMATN
ncbi:Leucine-rich repeat-containing protein 15 [Toxocara canis]|uniref:Leucine-rich repeat-containing protein 15 n=1 Tax=Toxocara canis TaxID=6265 RepID=A0A0B2VMT2_TOXCA|nr:Leucine-rich repeat-containing protein 15 [Toxocara canis]